MSKAGKIALGGTTVAVGVLESSTIIRRRLRRRSRTF